jgi:hypothetical protein
MAVARLSPLPLTTVELCRLRWPLAPWAIALTLALIPASVSASSSAVAAADPPEKLRPEAWHSIPLPGGVSALCEAIGFDPPPDRFRVILEVARRVYSTHDSVSESPLATMLRGYLETPEMDPPGGPDLVPLPLAPEVWQRSVLERSVPEERIAGAILSDRAAALLYVGLAALDEPTRSYFVAHQGMLRDIHRRYPGVFAAFGRSLRIENDRMMVPGGADAVRLWEALVGEKTTNPQRFILRLLAKDLGRLAFFYDTIAQLDDAHTRFALRIARADITTRTSRLRSL